MLSYLIQGQTLRRIVLNVLGAWLEREKKKDLAQDRDVGKNGVVF